MKSYTAFIIIFVCFIYSANAQVNEVWSARYNGAGNTFDGINAMTIDDAGNVYVTGSVSSPQTSNDICTIKYNSSGDTLWVSFYNGTGNNLDIGRALVVDKDGNVYVTGESRNGSAFETEDYVTIKYNPNGDSVWVKRYDGLGAKRDFPRAIGLDDSANVYVSGLSWGNNNALDITTIKYNTNGNEQWVERWSGTATFAFSSDVAAMAVTGSGNIYITGHVNNQTTFWDFATLKYDRNGNILWHAYYSGTVDNVTESATDLTLDTNENVYVTGTNSAGLPVTIKYNSDGQALWTSVLSSSITGPKAIAVDNTDNVYVGGDDFCLIKYNSTGDTLWTRKYGETNFNFHISSIAVNAMNEIFVAGRNGRTGSNDYDFTTVKYNQSGDTLWSVKFNGPASGNDEANVVKISNDGSIVVAGYSTGIGTNGDMYVVKYSDNPTNIISFGNSTPTNFYLSQNYPNPFNPSTIINFQIPLSGFTTVRIYDALGRMVNTLVNANMEAGNYNIEFNASGLSSGIYFYEMRSKNFRAIKKMVLMK